MSPRNILRVLATRRKTTSRRPRRQRLGAEPLESRAMLSTVPFLTDPALPAVTLFTAQGRYGNNALNGDWEVGLTRNTNGPIDSQAHRRWANLNQTAQPSSQQTVQPEPFSFTVKRDLAATFTVGGTKVAFGYGGQSTANQPNAIKIWAKASTANSGLTIDNLKLTTPGMAVPMEFPGTSIAVSRSSGPDFQQLVIAGIDFTSGLGPAVELTGNVLMSFGAPAPRGSSLQFHVMAVYVPPVDLDVDSDNDGTFVRSAFEELEEDAGVVAGSNTPTKPGLIVPVGGPRAEMVVEVPAGRTTSLALIQDVERVKVYAQPTGGDPLALPLTLTNAALRGSTTFTYWIDAVAPSESMADIAFTLTTSGTGPASSDTVRATAVAVDLSIDDLPTPIEDGSGAVIWRNSDFSRNTPAPGAAQTEPGLTRYLPDYANITAIDPAFASQFTKARATFTQGMAVAYEFRFNVGDPAPVALWAQTPWDGFVAAADGWWRIPTDTTIRPKAATDRTLDFWIEGLRSTGYAAGNIEFEAVPLASQMAAPPSDAATFTVLDAGLGVDGNRDGTIDFADSFDRQLTFWLNDDRDVEYDPALFGMDYYDKFGSPYETEDALYAARMPAGAREADAANDAINTKRDLEDLAAIHLQVDSVLQGARSPFARSFDRAQSPLADKPLVRFDLSLNAVGTAIRLFRAADPSTLAHVQQPDSAAMQTGNARFRYNAEDSLTTGISRGEPALVGDLTLHSAFDSTKRSERPEFLFEAFGQPVNTTLTMTVTVTYPQPAGGSGGPRRTSTSHQVSLDLRSIKDLYTRMKVPYRTGGRDDRFTHFVPGTEDLPHFGAAQALSAGNTRGIPFLSGTETVVLVHGWNMTDGTQTRGPATDWKRAFAETAFKRLYWQGFRGNVAAFDWPTFADQEGRLQGDLAFFNLTYNASEYQAFRSGRSLMTFLADKKATGPVHLLAHSMGNVVAAEALRQWTAAGNGQALVGNYVAMQGALSAGAYGDDATDATGDDPSGYDYYRYWPDRWLGAEHRYYMQGTDQAAGKWINMFNELDRATSAELAWVGNNRMKPGGGDIWRVQSATGSPTPQFIGYRVDRPEYGGRLLRSYVVNGLPSDEIDLKQWLVAPGAGQLPGPAAYEALAFMSKANAKPIGTKVVDFFVRANGTNIDISDLGLRRCTTINQSKWH
jgi:hypothetical protein